MKFNQGFRQTDLCGNWQFSYSDDLIDARTITEIRNSKMDVPGNFELDLLENGIIPDPYFGKNIKILRDYERKFIYYFRRFNYIEIGKTDPYLVFEGLDCIADVFINGKKALSNGNMMVAAETNVKDFLNNGSNEILVVIHPAASEALKHDYPLLVSGFHANYESLYIRKPAHMFGWDILPRIISAGIFKPVYIEHRSKSVFIEAYLQTVTIEENSASSMFFYKCSFDKKAGDEWSIRLKGNCGSSGFYEDFKLSFEYGKHLFQIKNPLLWNVRGRGKQHLYEITAELYMNGGLQSTVHFTHGIRTIKLQRTGIVNENNKGEFVFNVNGEKIFAKGTNWVPVDAFHSRDKERIPKILGMAADINCNMIRCWGGNLYEDDMFYDICDREGILVWQDFAMACAVYPQDQEFQNVLKQEAVEVIKRLRQHPCLALWAGDNECDQAYSWFGFNIDPNTNVLTRSLLPEAVRQHDPFRSYLPSSPYIEPNAFGKGDDFLPENHLWGKRDYFKSSYYAESTCRFASEMGYHGCPSPESIKRFISKDCIWPYDNEEWLLHSTSPLPEIDKRYNFRVQLMANQIKVLFGEIPENIDDFSIASQISQAEAKKFFIELFRGGKWERTGILWWNLMDGWPQFSDAVVDYYFNKKIAYDYIKRSQRDILMMFKEPAGGKIELVICNDTPNGSPVIYKVTDIESGSIIIKGDSYSPPDSVSSAGFIEYDPSMKVIYYIEWTDNLGNSTNHYLCGTPPYGFDWYTSCLSHYLS